MQKLTLQIGFLVIFTCFILSCEHMQTLVNDKTEDGINKKELPKWTISINQVIRYPRANLGEKEVPSYNGENVWVRKHFELNSKLVELITEVPSREKNKSDIKLKLDKHGSMIAMRLCNESPQPFWGLLIEGIYYGEVRITKATQKEDDYSEILLQCCMDKATSRMIAKYAVANYEHLHKNEN